MTLRSGRQACSLMRQEQRLTRLDRNHGVGSVVARWCVAHAWGCSVEELVVANFLAEHGIRYTYERDYPVDTATRSHRQYQPDFYLPDSRIYIEHFALDEHGRPPGHWKGYAEGVLIYCRTEGGKPAGEVTVRHAGKVLHVRAVDLRGSPYEVAKEIESLAGWIAERARAVPLNRRTRPQPVAIAG